MAENYEMEKEESDVFYENEEHPHALEEEIIGEEEIIIEEEVGH